MEIEKILTELTIKEKINLLSGKNFWESKEVKRIDLPRVFFSDGPHGLRKQNENADNFGFNKSVPATCFPTASVLACSFDKDLMYKLGESLAKECKKENVDVLLGPGISLKRHPLCGRNFEYFSEDPYLSGKLAASYIQGVQSLGIGTSLKHFACNNQEMNRLISNSVVDERTLNEIYLKGFEIAIKEGKPYTVMSSYNMINGIHSSQNKMLLTDTLRNKWGYKGAVISDWGAINNPTESFKNGLNLEMPGLDKSRNKEIIKSFKQNLISIEEIDNACKPIIELAMHVKAERENKVECSIEENQNLARILAENSNVLLKNEDKFLPLKATDTLAIIGPFAKEPRYQGEGSSNINPITLDCFLDAIKETKYSYEYAPGYLADNDTIDEALAKEAIDIAKKYDKIIYFMGIPKAFESEGFDRTTLLMPNNQIALLKELSTLNPNIIIIFQGGGVVDFSFDTYGKALISQFLSGAKSGTALLNLLIGSANPSGKLAETIPLNPADIAIDKYPENNINVCYSEGQYVGYRYYTYKDIPVKYPFGYGLSYTTFEFSNPKYYSDKNTLSFSITNTGDYPGKEVIQLYVSYTKNTKEYKQLKDFIKVDLNPQETKQIEFVLRDDEFEFYSIKNNSFVKGTGEFTVKLGTSSNDFFFSTTLNIAGTQDYEMPKYPISFHDLPRKTNNQKGKYDLNSTTVDLNSCRLGRFINRLINKFVKKMIKEDPSMEKVIRQMLTEGPLRMLLIGTNGKFTYKKLQGLVDILNGHFFKGIHKIL